MPGDAGLFLAGLNAGPGNEHVLKRLARRHS